MATEGKVAAAQKKCRAEGSGWQHSGAFCSEVIYFVENPGLRPITSVEWDIVEAYVRVQIISPSSDKQKRA